MSETKHKNMVVRMPSALYATMQEFASLNKLTVSDVMRYMCEAIADKMKHCSPPPSELVDEVMKDHRLTSKRAVGTNTTEVTDPEYDPTEASVSIRQFIASKR